jgi:hypothetical protein
MHLIFFHLHLFSSQLDEYEAKIKKMDWVDIILILYV